jgi:electron transfer flavoprotein alpha subunit
LRNLTCRSNAKPALVCAFLIPLLWGLSYWARPGKRPASFCISCMKRHFFASGKPMEKKIFIISETDQGNSSQETFELISFARELSCGQLPTIILLGSGIEAQAKDLSEKTGCDTVAVIGNHLGLFNTQAYAHAIMDILPPKTPLWVCLPHTSMGYDLAPLLAVSLNAACITAVDGIHSGALSRSIYSGRFIMDIIPWTPTVVVTVLPGAFESFALWRISFKSCF